MKEKLMLMLLMTLVVCSAVSAYTDSVFIEDYDLEVEYDSAISGDVFSLTLSLTNTDNDDRNFSVEFDESNPFEFISDTDWDVEVGAGDTVSKTFRIEVDDDVISKNYDLEFNLDDGDDDWDDEFKVKVTSDSAEISLGEIVSSPKKIIPGSKDVTLDVTIKNDGDFAAEDLVATLVLPNGFEASSSYSDKVYLGDLDGGESETLTFYFDVDDYLAGDDYSAKIEFDYEVDGEDESDSLSLDLPVFSIPQFEIADVQVVSEKIYAGKTSEIKVALKNVGGEDASDVSLRVYERSDQPFSFEEKSAYVGSLDVGQIGYAVFTFDTEKDAGNMNYILDLQVRSVSGDSVIVDDVSTNLNVSVKEFNFGDYIIFVIIGVLVLLGAIIFVVWRY